MRVTNNDNHRLGQLNHKDISPAPRGVPQIEVTLDIDADGILNVTAADASTNKITITNDKGRLSKDTIEKMVNEAKKFKAEDDAQKEILAAKNGLEAYIFQVKLSLDEQAIKNKLSKPDKNMLNREMDDALTWLDRNQAANMEEYKDKQKELEGIVNPIMSWLHRG